MLLIKKYLDSPNSPVLIGILAKYGTRADFIDLDRIIL
jgi:hypothetical protein